MWAPFLSEHHIEEDRNHAPADGGEDTEDEIELGLDHSEAHLPVAQPLVVFVHPFLQLPQPVARDILVTLHLLHPQHRP